MPQDNNSNNNKNNSNNSDNSNNNTSNINNSKMYKYPRKIVAGDDYQQQFILSIIHKFEIAAYKKMWEHFPIFQNTLEKRGLHIKKEFGISLENWLSVVNQ